MPLLRVVNLVHKGKDRLCEAGSRRAAETLAEGPDGEVYVPDAYGRIKRTTQKGRGPLQDWAYTGGRPLGIVFDHDGNLLVADAVQVRASLSPDLGTRVCLRRPLCVHSTSQTCSQQATHASLLLTVTRGPSHLIQYGCCCCHCLQRDCAGVCGCPPVAFPLPRRPLLRHCSYMAGLV
jgi:hypothetical protein